MQGKEKIFRSVSYSSSFLRYSNSKNKKVQKLAWESSQLLLKPARLQCESCTAAGKEGRSEPLRHENQVCKLEQPILSYCDRAARVPVTQVASFPPRLCQTELGEQKQQPNTSFQRIVKNLKKPRSSVQGIFKSVMLFTNICENILGNRYSGHVSVYSTIS